MADKAALESVSGHGQTKTIEGDDRDRSTREEPEDAVKETGHHATSTPANSKVDAVAIDHHLLIQIQASLPEYLTNLESGRISRAIHSVNHVREKVVNLMRRGGSKRLLRMLGDKIEQAQGCVTTTVTKAQSRLDDQEMEELESSLHTFTELVSRIGICIEEYLFEHEMEDTVSEIDSIDCDFERLIASFKNDEREPGEAGKGRDAGADDRKKQESQGASKFQPEQRADLVQQTQDQDAEQAELERRLERLRISSERRSSTIPDARQQAEPSRITGSCNAGSQAQILEKFTECLDLLPARAEVPPAPIETFHGDPAEYMYFIRNFRDRVDSRPFTQSTKLAQLIDACRGRARAEILPYKGQTRGYEKALECLKYNYGQPTQIMDSTIQRLTSGPELRGNDIDGLKAYARDVENTYDLLEEMDMISEADTQFVQKAIFSRLPQRLRVRWVEKVCDMESKAQTSTKKIEQRTPKFKDLKNFISDSVKRSFHPVFQVQQNKGQAEQQGQGQVQGRPVDSRLSNRSFKSNVAPRNTTSHPRPPTWSADLPRPREPAQYQQVRNTQPGSYISRPSSQQHSSTYHVQPKKEHCIFCERNGHDILSCPSFALKPVSERRDFVFGKRLCFACLSPHRRDTCTKKDDECPVNGCAGRHHRLIHVERSQPGSGPETSGKVEARTSNVVLLRIVPVQVSGKNRSLSTYAMLDGGSTCSIMKESVAAKLGIEGRPSDVRMNTVTRQESEPVRIASCKVSSLHSSANFDIKRLHVMRHAQLSGQLETRATISARFHYLRDLKLPRVDIPEVSLLIGEETPAAHWIYEYRFGKHANDGPYAARTPLGWYIAGPTETPRATAENRPTCNHVSIEVREQDTSVNFERIEKDLDRLWSEERHTFGNGPERTTSVEDRVALRNMQESVKLVDGHYSVPMLWKNTDTVLPSNIAVARKCLASIRQRMIQRPSFGAKYREMMDNYVTKGYAVKMTPQEAAQTSPRTWYLPHHEVESVAKPDKVRVVFNAASTFNGISLNSQLVNGPDLNNNLLGCIMKFRLGPVALNGDVMEMFHQVRVPPQDADPLRFLWYDTGQDRRREDCNRYISTPYYPAVSAGGNRGARGECQ